MQAQRKRLTEGSVEDRLKGRWQGCVIVEDQATTVPQRFQSKQSTIASQKTNLLLFQDLWGV